MKISIITATYNSADTIADCIESVNNQTYQDIEHIIIDGRSKDNTIYVIKSLPNRVTKIISEPDNGIYDALNKGIKMATGDIIGFLHSDDLFAYESTLFNISNTFNKTGADGVYGVLFLVDKNDVNKIIRTWKSQQFHSKLLKRGWMPAHPTLFLKKEVYKKHGLFDLSYKISADYDFMLRIFKEEKLKFVYLPEIITKMRIGGTSNGSVKKIIQKTKEDFIALKRKNIPHPYKALLLKKISKITQYF